MKGTIQNARQARKDEAAFEAHWHRREQERLALARKRAEQARDFKEFRERQKHEADGKSDGRRPK
jgi:hypothetical protein